MKLLSNMDLNFISSMSLTACLSVLHLQLSLTVLKELGNALDSNSAMRNQDTCISASLPSGCTQTLDFDCSAYQVLSASPLSTALHSSSLTAFYITSRLRAYNSMCFQHMQKGNSVSNTLLLQKATVLTILLNVKVY
jgi:hypothetical protein